MTSLTAALLALTLLTLLAAAILEALRLPPLVLRDGRPTLLSFTRVLNHRDSSDA
jgi:hypothetical protein